jgi:hypothetical protein
MLVSFRSWGSESLIDRNANDKPASLKHLSRPLHRQTSAFTVAHSITFALVFGRGLLHGMGFASLMKELDLP